MKFKIMADATFEAYNIDDAFIKMATYFQDLFHGRDNNLIELGEIHICKVKE